MSPASTITQEEALDLIGELEAIKTINAPEHYLLTTGLAKLRSFILSHPDGQGEDAERYRWLRRHEFASGGDEDADFRWAHCFDNLDALDEAIDAAARPLSSPVPQDSEDDNRGSA